MLKKCTKNVKFFEEVVKETDEYSHHQCCKFMKHLYIKAGETLFVEGY